MQNQKKLTLIFIAALLSLAQGCATPHHSRMTIPPGEGSIVVYRIQNYIAMFAGPSVFVDGKEIGKLYPGKYFEIVSHPGSHEIKFEGSFFNFPGPTEIMSVTIEPERTVYIELSTPGGGGPAVVTRNYHQRTKQEAEAALPNLSKSNPNDQ